MAVRLEKVVLELDDGGFSTQMAKNAAMTKLLERALRDLDGAGVKSSRGIDASSKSLSKAAVESRNAGREIDRLSGRMRLFADIAAVLGPALIPIGAVAVPAVTGLAAQLGAAALAGGTALIAFQGVGTALEAANKAAIEPTAENLEAARIAMQDIAPAAQEFVRQVQSMGSAFDRLQAAGASGLFPGLTAALDQSSEAFPQLEKILFRVGDAAGTVAEEFANGITGPRGVEFLAFIRDEVPGALVEMGQIASNLAAGLGELWQAFTPLNRDFSSWLLDSAEGFDRWSQGLAQTDGFQEFVEYIRENGPRVADALGSIGNAVLQIVEAAAPLGGPTLQALSAVADVIGTLADSDAGPAIMGTVTALALLNRGMKGFEAVAATSWGSAIKGADTFAGKVAAARSPLLRGAAAMGGFALASSDVAQGFALSNTASMALMGTIAGPWGAAIGGAVGLMLDLSSGTESFKVNSDELAATLNKQTGAITRSTEVWAANQLQQQGVLDAAEALGLNLADVTDAALGNEAAMARVTAGLEAAKAGFYDADGRAKVGAETLQDYLYNLDDVEKGINGTSGALEEGQGKFRQMAAATAASGDELRGAASAALDFRNAVDKLNAMLEGRASLRDYEAALDDFTAGLKANGRSFDINTEKGRLNQANLDNIAATMSRVVDGMKRSDRQPFMRQAREDVRDMREAGQLTEGQMRFLLRSVNDLDQSKANPKVTINTDGVAGAIAGVNAALNNIDDETVYINVKRGATAGAALGAGGLANGGTVPGPRPSPWRDNVLASLGGGVMALAGTEEVITNRNGEADRFRADRAAGRIPAYADGGTVRVPQAPVVNVAGSTWSGSLSLSDADVARIAAAVESGAYHGTAQRESGRNRDVRNAVRSGR